VETGTFRLLFALCGLVRKACVTRLFSLCVSSCFGPCSTSRLCNECKMREGANLLQLLQLYTGKIQEQAKDQLNQFMDFMREMEAKLDLECNNIDDAKQIMGILADIRDKEMDMEMEIRPIIQKYQILLRYEHVVEKEELDTVNNLPASWDKVVKKARDVSNNLFIRQNDFRAELLNNVEVFVDDVKNFRDDFIQNGPMEEGITPAEASERMRKYKFLYMERERKWRQYADGEALFGMPKTQYMEMDVTRKELELLDKLYTLYINVMQTIGEYRVRPWVEATLEMNAMTEQVNFFQEKARKMPKQLRSWEAYKDLTKDIEDFVAVLPLIQALSSSAMRPRHWQVIKGMSAVEFDNESPLLTLGGILETGLHKKRDQVEAICLSAERELEVEVKLADLQEIWGDTRFEFLNFKNKGPVLLKAKELSLIFDKVEDSTNAIGSMVGHSHSEPFREEVQNWIKKLTSVQEVLEQWTEVQSMW
jgi:dynein heavy chain